jgi:hypothetical protein
VCVRTWHSLCPNGPISSSHVPSVFGQDADGLVSRFKFDARPDSVTQESRCVFHFGMSGRLSNMFGQAW